MGFKKKISFFTDNLGYGGTERVVSQFCSELSEDYDIILILIHDIIDFPFDEKVKKIVLTNDDFDKSRSNFIRKSMSFIKVLWRYKKTLKQENVDLAFSFLARQNLMNSIIKIFNPNLITVISERCFPSVGYGGNTIKLKIVKFLFSFFYNRNNHLFSNSLYINEDLRNKFKVKIDSSVIYNPLQNDMFQNLFLPSSGNQDFKIITVGRLIPVKNHKSLIASLSNLSDRYKLNIFGSGNLENDLKEIIDKSQLSNRIVLRGTDPDIKNRLIEHHCFVLSSNSEGFPNALLEAMASGLPVISTNCFSGPLEMLNDNIPVTIPSGSYYKAKYGLLVNVNDPIGLSQAIKFYGNNESLRREYGDKGFKRSKAYSIDKIGLNLKKLIESVTN